MTGHWSRLATAIAGVAVGAVFLTLSLRGTAIGEVVAVLRAGDWLGPGATVLTGTAVFIAAKTLRWRVLLGREGALPASVLAPPVLAGLALNALIPHSGEFLRAASLQRRTGRSASSVLSSIVAERLFDVLGTLLLGAVALGFVRASPALMAAFRLLAVIAALLAGGVVAALLAPRAIRRLAALMARPLPNVASRWLLMHVDEGISGLEPVRSPATALRVCGWTLLQWLAVALCVYGSAGVAGFAVSGPTALLVVAGIVLAFLVPNAPGYLGAAQLAFAMTLVPLGVSEERALAASVVYQLLMIAPTILVGLALLRYTLRRGVFTGL